MEPRRLGLLAGDVSTYPPMRFSGTYCTSASIDAYSRSGMVSVASEEIGPEAMSPSGCSPALTSGEDRFLDRDGFRRSPGITHLTNTFLTCLSRTLLDWHLHLC